MAQLHDELGDVDDDQAEDDDWPETWTLFPSSARMMAACNFITHVEEGISGVLAAASAILLSRGVFPSQINLGLDNAVLEGQPADTLRRSVFSWILGQMRPGPAHHSASNGVSEGHDGDD